jgi:hypothetical protein
VGFVVDKVALGQVFSEYFGFPCQLAFHQMLHTHLSSEAGTISQLVVYVSSGLSLTPPQEIKKNTGDINIFLIFVSSLSGYPLLNASGTAANDWMRSMNTLSVREYTLLASAELLQRSTCCIHLQDRSGMQQVPPKRYTFYQTTRRLHL